MRNGNIQSMGIPFLFSPIFDATSNAKPMLMKHLLLLCSLCLSIHSFSQTRISDHNSIGWYAINIDPAITKKWSGHIEYQWRRDDVIKQGSRVYYG